MISWLLQLMFWQSNSLLHLPVLFYIIVFYMLCNVSILTHFFLCIPFSVIYAVKGLDCPVNFVQVEEREIVETCYRKGLLCVLTATSTLAAGVNLPARRVIFRQPRNGRDFIDGTRYRQMAGRAGRTGIDTKGESVCLTIGTLLVTISKNLYLNSA